jgi:ribosome-associated protein
VTTSQKRSIHPDTLRNFIGTRDGRSRLTPQESLALVERIAQIADDKLARDIVILDMADVVGYTDYFLIATGNTGRQTSAIAQEIAFQLKEEARRMPLRGDGKRASGDWILLDYLDVVVHLFTPEARDFYRLEQLWGQVPSRQYAPAASA